MSTREPIHSQAPTPNSLQVSQDMLTDSPQFVEQVLKTIPSILYVYDFIENRNIYINEGISAILGYTPEDLQRLGSAVLPSIIHPDDLAVILASGDRLKLGQDNEVYGNEYRLRHKNGEWRWVYDRATIFKRTPDGAVWQVIGSILDITDRKHVEDEHHKTEQQLQQQEAQYRSIFESVNDALHVFDLETGALVEANPAAYQMHGYTHDEFIALHPSQFIHADYHHLFQEFVETIRQGRSFYCEAKNVRRDGTAFDIEVQGTGFTYKGRPHILSIVRDISEQKRLEAERKHAEQSLKESRDLLSAIFNESTDAIFLLDADSNLILNCNQRTLEMFEVDHKDQLIGTRGETLHKTAWTEQQIRAVEHQFREKGTWTGEVEYLTKKGNAFWGSIAAKMIAVGQKRLTLVRITDISDRKRNEEAIRESEARFRSLTNNLPGVVYRYVLHPDGCDEFTYISPSGCRKLYELEAADIIQDSRKLWARVHPDDVKTIQHSRTLSATTLQTWHWEGRIITPSGHTKWIQGIAEPDRQINGDMVWDGIVMDVSDRKRAEAALKLSEEKFRSLSACSPIGIYLTTPEGLTTYTNPRCQEIFGVTAEAAMQGTDWMQWVHPDDRDRLLTEWMTVASVGQDYFAEYRIMPGEGQVRWVQTRTAPMVSDQGELIGHVGTIEDVTDRKLAEIALHELNDSLEQKVEERTLELRHMNQQLQAEIVERKRIERALRRSEELFRQVFENAPVGIAIAQPNDQRFIRLNPAFCDMLGYTADELLAEGCPQISDADDLEREAPLTQQMLRGEIPGYHLIKRYRRKDQHIIWGSLTTRTIRNEAGDILYLLGLVEDITERKQAEEALAERTRQLEATNRELESFSYSVSHDLRAPLRHVNGFVSALGQQLEQSGATHDPKVARYLGMIKGSSQRMGQLIDGLLTLSRVGRRQLNQTPIPLRSLVQTVVEQATILPEGADQQSAGGSPRSVEFVIHELPTVVGDTTLIHQVFVNLIDNAMKFSRDRPLARIEIGTSDADTIFIKDNGVGFQMEYADQLFGAFQRLHSQTEFEGTGIGLAIVQRIVHRHGGAVWAESQYGQGATFYVQFKRPSEDAASVAGG